MEFLKPKPQKPSFAESQQLARENIEFENGMKEGQRKMNHKAIAGDPNGFAGASEHSHQVALMAACAHYAEYFKGQNGEAAARQSRALTWFHAVPNGGSRGDGTKRGAMISGANMKAEGTKTGVSDLMLCAARRGYHGFAIEMKAPGKLSGESKEQKQYGAYLAGEGYLYAVFDNWGKAMRAIMWYLDFEHCLEWELPS